MDVLDLIFGKPTLRSVTEQLAKELCRRGDTKVNVDVEEGVVQVIDGPRPGMRHYARNLLHEVRKAPRAKRGAIIKRFAAGTNEFEQGSPDTYASVAAKLLPLVRANDEATLHWLTGRAQGINTPRTASRPLVADLVVELAIDNETTMMRVSDDQLTKWGLNFEVALEQALHNLRGLPEREGWRQISPGLWSGVWGDSYESSRMLLPDLIHRLNVKAPVVMVPFRCTILVASRHDDRAIEAMLSTVENSIDDNNRWVSFRPVSIEGTAWTPFEAPEALRERFRRLEVRSLAAGYAQQKEMLDKINETAEEDVFIASFQALTKDERVVTFAVWTEGVTHALLPVTDLVVFNNVDKGSEFHFMVPWAAVVDSVGSLMRPRVGFPRRYEIRAFPDSRQLSHLRAAAIA